MENYILIMMPVLFQQNKIDRFYSRIMLNVVNSRITRYGITCKVLFKKLFVEFKEKYA